MFNYYIAAKPKNGGPSMRVGSEDGYLTLTRKVMYCMFLPDRVAAEETANELNAAPIGDEYVFTVRTNK